MALLTINANYDSHSDRWEAGCVAYEGAYNNGIGWWGTGGKGWYYNHRDRTQLRWALGSLPARRLPNKIRLKVVCTAAGSWAHLLVVSPYGGNGQPDPEGDTCVEKHDNSGYSAYGDASFDVLRSVGTKWVDLQDWPASHIRDAKEAVNRFSLGLRELDDNDALAYIQCIEADPAAVQLEITYPSGGLPANKALVPMGLV